MPFETREIADFVARVLALLVGLTFHEFSHALVADQLGDRGPRRMGRLTLNPIPHIDPVGALMLLIARFGWAKPVMVNPYALRNGPSGMAMVAAAGPMANVVVAVVFAIVFRLLASADLHTGFPGQVVVSVVVINLILALFNFVPIPPLDGYNAALALLPPRYGLTLQRYGQYGMFILLGLIVLHVTRSPINPLGWILGLAVSAARALLGI
jgi:Zn-dependent protease